MYVYVKMVEKLNQRNFRNDIFILHNYPLIFNIHSLLNEQKQKIHKLRKNNILELVKSS